MGRQQFCDDISKLLSNQEKLFTNLLSHYIQRNRRDDVETTNSLDALNPLFNTGFSINSFKEKEVRIPVFENVKNLSVSLDETVFGLSVSLSFISNMWFKLRI